MMITAPVSHWSDGACFVLDFMNGTLPSTATFTRASNAWYFNSSGNLTQATSNNPRFDYGAPGSTTLRGLLMEDAKTNKAIQCRDLTQTAWSKTSAIVALDQTGIDGTASSASSFTASAANATVLQTLTQAASTSIFSLYLKRITGTGTVNITQDGGTTWTAVTLTSSWQRFKAVSASTLNPVFGIQVVTSGDAVAVDVAQFESATLPSSPIIPTTVSVTRAIESCQVSSIGWYNATYGTFFSEFYFADNTSVALNHMIFVVSDNSTANAFRAGQFDTQNTVFSRISTASVAANPSNTAAYVAGVNKYGLVYAAGTSKSFAMLNAGSALTSSPSSFPALATLTDGLRLGCNPSGIASAFPLNGHVRRFKYWNYPLTNTRLTKVTT